MSKDKKPELKLTTDVTTDTDTSTDQPAKLFLSEVDRMALDLSKEQRKTAVAEAKTALANNEKAELHFKYIVLQLYMKYGLTDQDAISEQGEIIKGGARQQTPPQS